MLRPPSWAVPESTASVDHHPARNIDVLPIEIWSKAVGLLTDRQNNTLSLRNFALVSKRWNEIARPFIFRTWELGIEISSECLSRQIDLLHSIFDETPTIANYFRCLRIMRMDSHEESRDFFTAHGAQLLRIIERLSNLSDFILDPDDGTTEMWLCLDYDYFFKNIPREAQQIFKVVCSLPSLQRLDIRGVTLPLAVFIHNPNLRSLTVAYGSAVVVEGSQPSEGSQIAEASTAQLSSFAMVLHGAMDESEILQFAPGKTLHTLMDLHPGLFGNLTSFEALTLVEEIEDIRKVLLETRYTLRHFACGLSWQRRTHKGRELQPPLDHESPSRLQNNVKLDFSMMPQLRSVELRYDSPKRIGFAPTFPAILSTLRTIPWKQLEKLSLIFAAVCPVDKGHEQWDYQAYTHQLDALISPYLFVKGQPHAFNLRDIQFWIIKNCKSKCNEKGKNVVYTPPTADVLFPILEERVRGREYMHLGCRVDHNGWAPEFQACIIGGWKPVEEDAE